MAHTVRDLIQEMLLIEKIKHRDHTAIRNYIFYNRDTLRYAGGGNITEGTINMGLVGRQLEKMLRKFYPRLRVYWDEAEINDVEVAGSHFNGNIAINIPSKALAASLLYKYSFKEQWAKLVNNIAITAAHEMYHYDQHIRRSQSSNASNRSEHFRYYLKDSDEISAWANDFINDIGYNLLKDSLESASREIGFFLKSTDTWKIFESYLAEIPQQHHRKILNRLYKEITRLLDLK